MRVLIAPDKFKGSLTAAEAARAIREGLAEALPNAEFDVCPLADGGEGTVDVCMEILGGEWIEVSCQDAIGRPISARYGWLATKRMAVMELSAASGLWRIAEKDRDPKRANTFGTGQLLKDALARGAQTIVIGLGGSATNDGGVGIAAALGWKFLDKDNRAIDVSPITFPLMHRFVPPMQCAETKIIALADVNNPLLGPNGSSDIYAPQKGASPEDVSFLERALEHLATLCREQLNTTWESALGAGAAGGSAFGLMTFCGAQLMPGFDWLSDLLNLDARVIAADIVVTGEGSLDAQTLEGKAPGAIARLARKHGKHVIAFAGCIEHEAESAFDACLPITNGAMELAQAMTCGAQLLRDTARRAGRFLFIL